MNTVYNKKPVAKKAAAKSATNVEKFYIAIINNGNFEEHAVGPDTLKNLISKMEVDFCDYNDIPPDFENDVQFFEVANKSPVTVKVTKSVEIL